MTVAKNLVDERSSITEAPKSGVIVTGVAVVMHGPSASGILVTLNGSNAVAKLLEYISVSSLNINCINMPNAVQSELPIVLLPYCSPILPLNKSLMYTSSVALVDPNDTSLLTSLVFSIIC